MWLRIYEYEYVYLYVLVNLKEIVTFIIIMIKKIRLANAHLPPYGDITKMEELI